MALKDWKQVWKGNRMRWDRKDSDVSVVVQEDVYAEQWQVIVYNAHTNRVRFETKNKTRAVAYAKSYMRSH